KRLYRDDMETESHCGMLVPKVQCLGNLSIRIGGSPNVKAGRLGVVGKACTDAWQPAFQTS
ncbi:hypothetical protein NPIL_498631, partial [Nephila pilipes]